MEKYIGIYKEFGFENAPYLKDSFESKPYENASQIAEFLRNGTTGVACPRTERDVFTGEYIKDETVVRTYGEYKWPQRLAYYVEKYNLLLPDDFERHILRRAIYGYE